MKSYTITVNGNVYDVTVEENVGGAVAAPVRKAAPVAPKAAPAPKAAGTAGGIKVTAGAAGKVFKIEANVGQKVSKGDT
ncbi:MAG: acetyl-CoA carboxylase biotin carboxyl carrier protein subunit, partial [Tyzzerella sp.]|nr:acetyl-CoA carboxylase biotin carboxyl carrier protein subunit [Tyzzerella sp.]